MDAETERLFEMCDVERKGYLTERDLRTICPQLDEHDIAFIFASLDADGSGRIEKAEFCAGFAKTIRRAERQGYNGLQRRASVRETTPTPPIILASPQSDEARASSIDQRVFEEEVYNSESDTNSRIDFALPCQEDVVALYEQLQTSGVPQLLKKFERVVGSFCKELKQTKEENVRLQHIYTHEKETYHRRMEEVETELDQQLVDAENKARKEERERLTREKEEMRAKMESEMKDMRLNITRLQKMERVLEQEGQKLTQQRGLQDKLKEVSCENDELKKNLAEHHLELAMIKSELAHTRADYSQKQSELQREQSRIAASAGECENMQRQLQLLYDANRKLHDTNDSLRDALDHRASVFQQLNLRSPSPAVAGERPASGVHKLSMSAGGLTDDEVESGLAFDGYTSSDRESEKPRGDVPVMMGLSAATGVAERTFRVVMCGDAAVGKSSLVMRVIKGVYTNNLPSTLGVDFHVKTVNVDGRNVALQLWDTAGQERFRSLCKSYFRRADGAILVYDVTTEHTFLRVRDWIDTIKESVEKRVPIILCGNKTDLRATRGGVPTTDGADMAASMGVLFMETSAASGSNVDNALLALTRELLAVEDVEIRATGVVLNEKTKQSTCFSRPSCSK